MEEELIAYILFLKKYYNTTSDLEDCTREVLRGKLGRKEMKKACSLYNITPSQYVKYLTEQAQKRLNKAI